MVDVMVVSGSGYITKSDECDTCEFTPPCRLCTWVSKDDMDDIYDDIEEYLPFDRKYHVAKRRKWARKLGFKENKGRGNSKDRVVRKPREVESDNIMVI